ncbi:MAG: hypothetical protein JWM85_2197, partial [Acidimicrobiaceae bacterium]|nr:hypothetical protein [Acidimicrobiaceae bacterium]
MDGTGHKSLGDTTDMTVVTRLAGLW